MNQPEIDKLAKIIWDYHKLNQKLKPADAILVLGSHDTRIAEYGAKLFLDGLAPLLIFSGGLGHLTKGIWTEPEADKFAKTALKMGVPKNKIIIENKSSNTGQNFKFTEKLLAKKGIKAKKFIIVQKPYMERRAYATAKKIWPKKQFIITSPNISFENYPDKLRPKQEIIAIIVGDLQRIKLYAKKGFQVYQKIPKQVWDAYKKLIKLGYIEHLSK